MRKRLYSLLDGDGGAAMWCEHVMTVRRTRKRPSVSAFPASERADSTALQARTSVSISVANSVHVSVAMPTTLRVNN